MKRENERVIEGIGEKSVPMEIRLEKEDVGRWNGDGRWNEWWKDREAIRQKRM